jgi:hypothetical protein
MSENVNPADPNPATDNDGDTEGHRLAAFAAPVEEPDSMKTRISDDAEDDDTEGHRKLVP